MIIDLIKEAGSDIKMLEGHDRFHYLIDKAKEIKPLPEWLKTETNRIHGCASKLWITGTKNLKDGTMNYHADGESHITKGTAVVVTNLVNGQKAEEVASLTVEDFTPLGIKELLTMQRQNGLGELINRIIGIANANIHV